MQLTFVPLGKAIISIQSTCSYFEQINKSDKNLRVQNQTLLVFMFFIQKARPSRNLFSNTLLSQLSKIINKEKGETFNEEKKYNFISKTSVWLKIYYNVKNFKSHIFQHIIYYLSIKCYFLFITSFVSRSFCCLRCCCCFIMTSNFFDCFLWHIVRNLYY